VTGTPFSGTGTSASEPGDPEVAEKARRRRFTAQYKLGLLEEADRCEAGEIGALLRREGLYASHLTTWKRQRESGALKALGPRKRGCKAQVRDARVRDARVQRLEALERENERLRRRLAQAETLIEVPKKVSTLLGIALNPSDNAESA
jgi:hypothetical protein